MMIVFTVSPLSAARHAGTLFQRRLLIWRHRRLNAAHAGKWNTLGLPDDAGAAAGALTIPADASADTRRG